MRHLKKALFCMVILSSLLSCDDGLGKHSATEIIEIKPMRIKADGVFEVEKDPFDDEEIRILKFVLDRRGINYFISSKDSSVWIDISKLQDESSLYMFSNDIEYYGK